jgi:hypothetical protein
MSSFWLQIGMLWSLVMRRSAPRVRSLMCPFCVPRSLSDWAKMSTWPTLGRARRGPAS